MHAAGEGPGPRRRGAGLVAAGAAALLALACGSPEALTACEPHDGLTPVCGFRNPEDLVPLDDGWVVVSQYPAGPDAPGSLVAWRAPDGAPRPLFPAPDAKRAVEPTGGDPSCPGPPDEAAFGPHGIDLAPTGAGGERVLWVVNHGGREALERFTLTRGADGAPRATWQGCVPLPDPVQANDVAAHPDGGFVVSWMLSGRSGVRLALSFGRLLAGMDTGRVLRWSPDAGLRAVPGSEARAPNGVALSPDGETLFVAAWGGEQLLRLGLDGSGRREVPLPHHPDNLSWGPDGRLWVAGQQGAVADVLGCARLEAGTCGMGWSVVTVDPERLTVEPVVGEQPARTTGAVSVALETEGRVLLGTFAGDRVAWRPR